MKKIESLTEEVINNATDKNTIKDWFKTGLKPLQSQFWALMDSYWHKDEDIPMDKIQDLMGVLNDKAAISSVAAAVLQIEENHNSAIQKSTTYTRIHSLVSLTQAEYDAIEKKDATTIYFIQ